MLKLALSLLLLPWALPHLSSAQSALSIAPQQCAWRAGDDLRWAAPDLDQSESHRWLGVEQWSTLSTPTPRFWLRCRFQGSDLAASVQPELQISGDLSYEVFVDGQRIGASGDVATGEHTVGLIQNYASPALSNRDQPILVALRMTFTPQLNGQQQLPQLTLGNTELRRGDYFTQVITRVRKQWITWACYSLIASAGLFFFALYWFDRTQQYLFWISLTWLSSAVLRLNELLLAASVHYPSRLEFFLYALGQGSFAFGIQFFFTLNQRPVPRFFRVIQAIDLCAPIALMTAVFLPIDWSAYLRWIVEISLPADLLTVTAALIGCSAPLVAFRPLRSLRGSQVLFFAVSCLWMLMDASYLFIQYPIVRNNLAKLMLGILPFRSLAIAAVVVSVTLLLVQRLRAGNRQRAILEGEMQAARHIQQLLAPANSTVLPAAPLRSPFSPHEK